MSNHLSRPTVASWLKRFPRRFAQTTPMNHTPCSRLGLPLLPIARGRSRFTATFHLKRCIRIIRSVAVLSLWHFPYTRVRFRLETVLSYAVRTFL